MKRSASGWLRAAKGDVCPLCQGEHACSQSPQGLLFCRRCRESTAEWRYIREDRHGTFGVFAPADQDGERFWRRQATGFPQARQPKPAPPPAPPPPNWCELLAERTATDADVERLADVLGLPAWTLQRLGVGFGQGQHYRNCWLFPEMDAAGNVIGVLQRLRTGRKLRWGGSKAGLSFAPGTVWTGDVFTTEGPTDTASLLAMGFESVVGRPSNSGGAELLAELLGPAVRSGTARIVVIGDRDERELEPGKLLWPGRQGAERVSRILADTLGVPVRYCFPPPGVKDVRQLWQRDGETAKGWLLSCLRDAVTVEPTVFTESSKCRSLSVRENPCSSSGPNCDIEPRTDKLRHGTPFGPSASQVLVDGYSPVRCQRGYAPVLLKRGSKRSATALRVGCRRISCGVCRRYKLLQLLVHAACLFHDVEGWRMFTTTVPGRRYTALRQQVLRLNGDYAAVRLPGDVLHAVLSVPLKDTQPVGPASAVEFYASALLAVDVTSRRPFLFSERWKVPPRPKGDNERLGSVPGREFPELLSRLRDAGLMPQDQGERSVDGEEPQRVARWSAPVEMTDGAHIDVVSRAILDLGGHVRGRNGHCNGKPFEMHAQGDTDESGAWDVAHPDETGF